MVNKDQLDQQDQLGQLVSLDPQVNQDLQGNPDDLGRVERQADQVNVEKEVRLGQLAVMVDLDQQDLPDPEEPQENVENKDQVDQQVNNFELTCFRRCRDTKVS